MAHTDTKRKGSAALRRVVIAGVGIGIGLVVGWRQAQWSPSLPVPAEHADFAAALRSAIRAGEHQRVANLLAQGADVETRDEAGETLLMQAAVNADAAMVRLLLEYGADPNARSPQGDPVLLRAIHDRAKVRLLLDRGARVEDRIIVSAAGLPGSRPTLELLLRAGGRLDVDVGGFTPLMAAAYCGDLECVQFLLQCGAQVNARTPAGLTALIEATLSGNVAIVKELLARGADPNAWYQLEKPKGPFLTPVLAAASLGDAACLRLLLERGADVHVQGGPFDASPLLCAATTGSEETVRLLLAYGANPQATDWAGHVPLDWARRRGETGIVEMLLRSSKAESRKPKVESRKPKAESSTRKSLAVDAETVAAAVRRTLPLLQPSGIEFTRRKGCVSCHQQSHVAVVTSMARARGFPVDEKLAAQEHEDVIAFFAAKPEILLGLGLDPLLAPWTLWSWEAEGQAPSPLSDALVHYLVLLQTGDGSWRTPGYRPPADASPFTFTALALRSLQTYAPPGRRAEIQTRIDRAKNWLLKATAAETEDKVWQLLGLHWSAAGAEAVRKAADPLLGEQRPDGGWGQLTSLPSDAYATGEVLYALHEAGILTPSQPAYQRGLAFLLQTQWPDGSWFVPTRSFPVIPYFSCGFPHGRAQFISTSATCWATMALLLSVPGSEDVPGYKRPK
jgi:ankyrin repeat protein